MRKVIDLKKIIFATWWNVPIYAFAFSNVTLTRKEDKIGEESIKTLSMKATGKDWFGHPFISFICELPQSGKYRVSIDAVKGPEQGQVQIFVDEAPRGKLVDLYAAKREKGAALPLAVLEMKEGNNNILFKITGKNEKSGALGFDLQNIICEKVD